MARRRGVDHGAVLAAALEVADREGADAVTLARVADALGIAAPSLYSHVHGLAGLRRDLAVITVGEFGERLRDASMGRSGDAAVRAVAQAFWDYGRDFPGRYQLTMLAADPADAEHVEVGRRSQEAVAAVIRSYGLDKVTARRAGRAFHASLHGLLDLERRGTTPRAELEGTFHYLVEQFVAGLHAAASAA